jgi:glutathione peroxidase
MADMSGRDTIYSISVRDIDGVPVDLENFRGKKILLVVLPVSSEDTSVTLAELNALQSKYHDSLIVIGVLAEEFGYSASIKQSVKNLYASPSTALLLVEGMKVRKASGTNQSPLFRFLTDGSKNGHYNRDVQGTGDKFFIDEKGLLYAVTGKQVRLSSPVVEKIISKHK